MRYPTSRPTRLRGAVLAAAFVSATIVTSAAPKGPDAGGYSGTNETVYSFVDLSLGGAPSVLANVDDGTAVLTLPFPFRFYGQPRTLACVSANGAVYFVPNDAACGGLLDFANTDITGTQSPGDHPAIFPFWSDLSFDTSGGAVFYQTQGAVGSRQFIIQWNNAAPSGLDVLLTFQAILSEASNSIRFQYKTVDFGSDNPASKGALATIGIRNAGAPANDQQLPWSYNAAVIENSSAILFTGESSDTTAPVTTAILTGAVGANGWRTGPAQVSLTAFDDSGAVAGTFYQLDGGAVQTYGGPFTITGDGTHQLSFYSRDGAGNQEAAHGQNVMIDATQPIVTASANPSSLSPPNGQTVQVTVSGSISDVTSGVDLTTGHFAVTDEYAQVQPTGSFSIAPNGQYSFTVALVASRQGNDNNGRQYSIAVDAKDLAGNTDSESVTVVVPHDQHDAHPPKTTARVNGPLGDNGWYTDRVRVILHASDPDHNLGGTFYRLDGRRRVRYVEPIRVDEDGEHHLEFYSTDRSGNEETHHNLVIKIDDDRPFVRIDARPDKLEPANGRTVQVTVSGTIKDATSGIEHARLNVIDEYGQVQPSASLTIGSDGKFKTTIGLVASRRSGDRNGRIYRIVVHVKDVAGNADSDSATVEVPGDHNDHR